MGWVRGQTGEQKRKEKQRKALPGSSRIRTGGLGPEARYSRVLRIHRAGEDRQVTPSCGPAEGSGGH